MFKYTAIPKDYIPVDDDAKRITSESANLLPDMELIYLTTILPRDSDNRSKWLTRRGTMLKVIDITGFLKPVSKSAQVNHVVKETKKMGNLRRVRHP